jgi:hypothetical protein
MATIDPDAALKIQPELLSGESLQWAGKPNPGVIFHSDDWYLVPFSLLWGGFTIFWEASVLGYWARQPRSPSTFMVIWGIPFILIGQCMIWGRFLYDAWLKRRTYYAVTNRRVLVLQEGWHEKRNRITLREFRRSTGKGQRGGQYGLGRNILHSRGERREGAAPATSRSGTYRFSRTLTT